MEPPENLRQEMPASDFRSPKRKSPSPPDQSSFPQQEKSNGCSAESPVGAAILDIREIEFDDVYERDEWLEARGYRRVTGPPDREVFVHHPTEDVLTWDPTGYWSGTLRRI